jgi:hypothetical protein
MKLIIFSEFVELRVVGLTKTHLRIRFMKLGTLGDCAE